MRIAIIGSGLAGSVLAERLAGHVDVTVFERGGNVPERPEPPVQPGHPIGLHPSFAYGVGGTTNVWHGGLVEMSDDEMGEAWPDALKRELPDHYAPAVRQLYGEDARRGWLARRIDRPAEDIIATDRYHPADAFGAAEAGFLSMATLLTGRRATRVEETNDGVRVHSERDGELYADGFDLVVIAAGGINSPLILKASGLGGAQVGHNLTDHPMGFVAKLRSRRPSDGFRRLRDSKMLKSTSSEAMLKIHDPDTGLTVAYYLRPAGGPGFPSDPYRRSFRFLSKTTRLGRYLAAFPHLHDRDFLWQALENQFGIVLPSSYAYVLALAAQEPTGQGSVGEDSDGRIVVDWRVSDDVERAIRRGLDRLADHLGAELEVADGDLRRRIWSAAHHSGTCRISLDPDAGVVDTDLRVHGTSRIYVCDGSVLPSTGVSNTGLTIAALARRLAARIAGEATSVADRPRLHISGVTGAIGRMMRAHVLDLGIDWCLADLRGDAGPVPGRSHDMLLHLANAHGSVDDNLALQRRTADYLAAAGLSRVIVPMSGSTILEGGPGGIRPELENLGFRYEGSDPYPLGKLAAERFWIDWQANDPRRRVVFVYIPTITGPRSAWTRNIALHAPGKTLAIPRLDHFFAVSEDDLCALFAGLLRSGLDTGVSRRFALSADVSLADTVASDRDGGVAAVALPGVVWSAIRASHASGLVGKALSVVRVLGDRFLRGVSGYAVIPVSPRYLHLFRRQSDIAELFATVRRADEAPPIGNGTDLPATPRRKRARQSSDR